jgi:hypothetical protein
MAKYALLIAALALAGCSTDPYVRPEPSAAAGGSAPGQLMVKVDPDDGSPTQVLPTEYPDFRPGDRVKILPDGRVVPL